MSKFIIIFAHPQFQYSRVNHEMIKAARKIDGVKIRDLYELYPDFHINVKREQTALDKAEVIILQHPFQRYSCPSLTKEWIDVVLQEGRGSE